MQEMTPTSPFVRFYFLLTMVYDHLLLRQILTYFKSLALNALPDKTQRNALRRALAPRCEDPTMNTLDEGSISFFFDQLKPILPRTM